MQTQALVLKLVPKLVKLDSHVHNMCVAVIGCGSFRGIAGYDWLSHKSLVNYSSPTVVGY